MSDVQREERHLTERHFDLVVNDWGNSEQRRIGWLAEEYAHVSPFSEWGSYAFRSDFHTQAECPWNDYPSNVVPMVEGDLGSLRLIDEEATDG